MNLRKFIWTHAVVALLASNPLAAAWAQNFGPILKEIGETADSICGNFGASGQSSEAQISGDIKAGLSGLAKRLTDLGVSGTGKITSNSYEGVLQQELAGTLKDIRQCKLTVFESLKQVLLPPVASSPSPVRNPNSLYQYGESVAEGQGAVIDQAHSTVTFQMVRTAGRADGTREFEYQDWVVKCPQMPAPAPNTFVGVYSGVVAGMTCTIVRKRP